MYRKYKESIYIAAKKLRKNQTKTEIILWNSIKAKQLNGFKFRRQVPYDRFILDFLCSEKKLIIEVDGSSHNGFEDKDNERDNYFEAKGYIVLRFCNNDILYALDNVLDVIKEVLVTT